MLISSVIINGQVWTVKINGEDDKEPGCYPDTKEIYVDGNIEDDGYGTVTDNLYRFLRIAVDYEYSPQLSPSDGEIEYIRDKMLMAYRLRI